MAENTHKPTDTPTGAPKAKIAALIVAAGSASRMAAENGASSLPKQFLMLGDKPVLRHSIDAFASHPDVVAIVITAAPEQIGRVQALYSELDSHASIAVVEGGATRQASVHAGLNALSGVSADLVAIHDSARPLLDHAMIDRLGAAINGDVRASLPLLPIADTIKSTADGYVTATIERAHTGAAQTPQMFILEDIKALHDNASASTISSKADQQPNFTDDISMAEAAGITVAAVPGSPYLMKITTQTDMALITTLMALKAGIPHQQFLAESTMANTPPPADIRVGNGYDVHKFSDQPGPIMLAGISVPSERGMLAHSDGDVGLHALCDAIFGALADGDIGSHFPPSDAKWKDADSAQFLRYAVARAAARNAQIMHLDLTIICEYPKITPHRDDMRQMIAQITGIAIDRIGVKATTSEGLGFTGRGEGIAAQATASLSFSPNIQAKDGTQS